MLHSMGRWYRIEKKLSPRTSVGLDVLQMYYNTKIIPPYINEAKVTNFNDDLFNFCRKFRSCGTSLGTWCFIWRPSRNCPRRARFLRRNFSRVRFSWGPQATAPPPAPKKAEKRTDEWVCPSLKMPAPLVLVF